MVPGYYLALALQRKAAGEDVEDEDGYVTWLAKDSPKADATDNSPHGYGPQHVWWEWEDKPTRCWADAERYDTGFVVPCREVGTGRLGLCAKHEEEVLGDG